MKSPFQFCALLVLSVLFAAVLIVVPAPMVKVPAPSAVALLRFKVPALKAIAPVPELLPDSVKAPPLVLFTAFVNVVSPLTTSDPVASMSQVCAAPTLSGAEIVTAPPPDRMRMPFVDDAGLRVSAPPVPAPIATAVTPVGVLLNCRLSTVNAALRLVRIVLSTIGAPAALKITASAAVGMLSASVSPPPSVVQLAVPLPSVFHDKS